MTEDTNSKKAGELRESFVKVLTGMIGKMGSKVSEGGRKSKI